MTICSFKDSIKNSLSFIVSVFFFGFLFYLNIIIRARSYILMTAFSQLIIVFTLSHSTESIFGAKFNLLILGFSEP